MTNEQKENLYDVLSEIEEVEGFEEAVTAVLYLCDVSLPEDISIEYIEEEILPYLSIDEDTNEIAFSYNHTNYLFRYIDDYLREELLDENRKLYIEEVIIHTDERVRNYVDWDLFGEEAIQDLYDIYNDSDIFEVMVHRDYFTLIREW